MDFYLLFQLWRLREAQCSPKAWEYTYSIHIPLEENESTFQYFWPKIYKSSIHHRLWLSQICLLYFLTRLIYHAVFSILHVLQDLVVTSEKNICINTPSFGFWRNVTPLGCDASTLTIVPHIYICFGDILLFGYLETTNYSKLYQTQTTYIMVNIVCFLVQFREICNLQFTDNLLYKSPCPWSVCVNLIKYIFSAVQPS